VDEYVAHLAGTVEGSLTGLKVVLDCAQGAASVAGPRAFEALGATVVATHHTPNGEDINADCGSTHPEHLQKAVLEHGADVGFAFDGDADRVLACDRRGRLLDGDDLLVLAARHLKRAGRLPGGGVAVTAMSNYGVRAALAADGIERCETPVGDRYLLSALRERGWALGAEPSGHLIDRNFAPSGDGTSAALLVLEALGGRDLAEVEAFARLPQVLRNVTVPGRAKAAVAHPDVRGAVAEAQEALAGRGRVLVRPSGTEPVVRILAEAENQEEAERLCASIAALVSGEPGWVASTQERPR
jgi:phosphoglucosamine mutase